MTETGPTSLRNLSAFDRSAHLPAFLGAPVAGMVVIVGLSLAATATEAMGAVLIYPILELIQSGQSTDSLTESSQFFSYVSKAFTLVGIETTLPSLIIATAVVVVARQALLLANQIYRAHFTYSAVEHLTSRVYSTILLANAEFTDQMRSGTIMNALFTEAKRAATLVHAILNMITGVIKLIVFSAVLLAISWPATLVGGALLASVVFLMSKDAIRSSKEAGQQLNTANDRVSRYAAERTGLFRLIKTSNTEPLESELFSLQMREVKNLQVLLAKYGARIQAFIEPGVILMALLLLYLAVEVLDLGLAGLGVFLLVLFRMMPVAQQIAVDRQQMASCTASLMYIDKVMSDARDARETDDGTREFPAMDDGIRFEGVAYSYPARDREPVSSVALRDVSLDIPAGSVVALLGPSGAGKSTMMDMIPRIRIPTAGRILFDGIPSGEISLKSLRRNIAMVSQEPLMIDGTIAENLRYGNPGASDEALREAARNASADTFIDRLPGGYETVLGERGIRLSGGQRQRIALARALMARVPILLLDEPTSALDSESEQAIQEALKRIQAEHKMTIVIIAHRLSTVRDADRIVVLDNNTVAGVGTHASLLSSLSNYRRIVELQTGEKLPPMSKTSDGQ